MATESIATALSRPWQEIEDSLFNDFKIFQRLRSFDSSVSGQAAGNDYRATGRTNPQAVNLSGTLTATTGSTTATLQINGGTPAELRVRP